MWINKEYESDAGLGLEYKIVFQNSEVRIVRTDSFIKDKVYDQKWVAQNWAVFCLKTGYVISNHYSEPKELIRELKLNSLLNDNT